jgi:hypothetical protein
MGRLPDSLRVLTLIQQLHDKFGAQEFGQIMQTLVALAFQTAGFQIVKNAVGVPDLQAFRADGTPGFAVEVKTGESTISLSKRDLDGVISTRRTPVLAALFVSDPTPRWWLVDAKSLRPISYKRYDLAAKPLADVGFDLTAFFSRVLVAKFTVANEGQAPLARLLAE